MSGHLNEGLFKESYAFVGDLRKERIANLKNLISEAKGPEVHRLREMLGEERDLENKAKERGRDKKIMKEIKEENKQRALKGLGEVYIKKRELKDRRHKEAFEKIEKEGKMKEFIEER